MGEGHPRAMKAEMKGRDSRAIVRSLVAGQGAALIASTVALVCRLALDPFLGDQLPYVTFFAGIAFATWFGGLAAGLTAAVLGGVAASWFFITPRFTLQVGDVSQQIGMIAYAAASLTLVACGHAMQRARQRAECPAGAAASGSASGRARTLRCRA